MTRIRAMAFAWLVAATLLGGGCVNLPRQHPERANLWHVVIVRLNQPGDEQARHKLIEATKGLRRIPGVQVAYVGHSLPGDRPQIDSTFDVGIVMGFATKEDLAAYLNNPIHQRAVRDVLKPLAKDYSIYDFTNE